VETIEERNAAGVITRRVTFSPGCVPEEDICCPVTGDTLETIYWDDWATY